MKRVLLLSLLGLLSIDIYQAWVIEKQRVELKATADTFCGQRAPVK